MLRKVKFPVEKFFFVTATDGRNTHAEHRVTPGTSLSKRPTSNRDFRPQLLCKFATSCAVQGANPEAETCDDSDPSVKSRRGSMMRHYNLHLLLKSVTSPTCQNPSCVVQFLIIISILQILNPNFHIVCQCTWCCQSRTSLSPHPKPPPSPNPTKNQLLVPRKAQIIRMLT